VLKAQANKTKQIDAYAYKTKQNNQFSATARWKGYNVPMVSDSKSIFYTIANLSLRNLT
jgi:hypothetical protein